MELTAINQFGQELESSFKLRSLPIALKFCENAGDVPKEAIYPKKQLGKHMALCQTFSYTRMKGLTMAMSTEDHWCWNPLVGFGNVSCEPGEPSFDEVCKYIGINDPDKARSFFAKFPRLPRNKYPIVVTAPLAKATFEPDVVLIYAEAAKINHMVRCIKSVLGDHMHTVLDGIDSCIYCTVPSFLENEYRVTFPDPGDRERARARDDEVILSVPGKRLEEFAGTIRMNNRFMGFGDRMFEFQLDFGHPPFYNTLFQMWGLDEGAEWDQH